MMNRTFENFSSIIGSADTIRNILRDHCCETGPVQQDAIEQTSENAREFIISCTQTIENGRHMKGTLALASTSEFTKPFKALSLRIELTIDFSELTVKSPNEQRGSLTLTFSHAVENTSQRSVPFCRIGGIDGEGILSFIETVMEEQSFFFIVLMDECSFHRALQSLRGKTTCESSPFEYADWTNLLKAVLRYPYSATT